MRKVDLAEEAREWIHPLESGLFSRQGEDKGESSGVCNCVAAASRDGPPGRGGQATEGIGKKLQR